MKKLVFAVLALGLLMTTAARAEYDQSLDHAALAYADDGGTVRSHDRGRVISRGAPQGCPRSLYCGCGLSLYLFKQNIRKLWLARNWLTIGTRLAKPEVGAVVVYARGRNGGHVGLITAVHAHSIRVLSWNDGRATRERERNLSGVLGFVRVASL